MQINNIVTDSENNVSIADVDNAASEKDNSDDWCEVDERPSGVTDTLLQERCSRK